MEVMDNDFVTISSGRGPRLWHKWVGLCRRINHFLEKAFTNLGYIITKRPNLTIILGVLISLALIGGFARYNLIKRAEDLYLPKNSEASKDLDRVEENFPMSFKSESFIIRPKDANAPLLTEKIFKEALEIHHEIMNIPGLTDVCIMNERLNTCAVLSPLEFFNFNISNIRNVSQRLHQVLNDSKVLSSDGRQAYTNFAYYFSYFETTLTTQGMQIVRADALKTDYFVKDPSSKDIYGKLESFEDKYVDIMSRKERELDNKGLILLYNFGRSIDISVSDSTQKDIILVPVALLLMVIFCGLSLARFRNRILGHFNLALAGVLMLFLAIASAFCFIMLIGAPYIAFAGVLPFLVLGVGIDDIFIIIDSVDRQHPSIKSNTRIAKALGEVCASITMTTLTDLVAFFVSMVTDFPAIRYFCMYAAFSITFCYILVITVFVALLSFDVKRIEAGQFDVIPCVANNKETTEEVWEEAGESMINKLITKYAEVLMLKPIKVIVIIISIGMTAFGIYGAINVDQSFNQLVLGLKGSAYVKYFGYFETGFPSGIPVNVVLDTPLNYTDLSLQQQYSNLSQIAIDNNYMESQTFNWMRDLLSWSENENITASGRHFYPSLYLFLQENQHYLVDIKFHKNWLQDMLEWSVVRQKLVTVDNFYQNLEQFLMETPQISAYMKYNFTTDSFLLRSNTKETFKTCDGECTLIKASRFIILTKANHFSIYRRDAMLSLREDLRTKTDLPVYGVSYNYIYVEQFVVILPDTIRNLAICASAILLITLPYLVDPKVTFFVFSGFVCLMFELFGVMYLWDVSLNAISMIIIVMGIGFSVDYSAHIAHAFVICNEMTSERRVIHAMRTMGASVTMGGISTFVGVVTTAFAQSELFKIFFKMVFGIVVLGLIHGLVFLPVFLAVFCKYNVPMTIEVDEEEENGNLSPKKNKMNGEEELLTMEDIPDTDKML